MQITNAEKGKILILGLCGENLARGIKFDFTEWSTIYGNQGSVQLIVKRAKDNILYPVVLEISGTKALWSITNSDTLYEGMGECQLQYIIDDVIVKSITWKTRVMYSLGETDCCPQPPEKSWVDAVLEMGAKAIEAAEKAEDSLDKQPYPNEETHTWWRYNSETSEFEDTREPYAGSGSDTTIFTQDVLSDTWTINHLMNKFPSVTIIDNNNNAVYADIKYIDRNNLEVKFNVPCVGKVYMN